jgi:hypothetical protein
VTTYDRQLLTPAQHDRLAAIYAAYLPTDTLVDVMRLPERVKDGQGGFQPDDYIAVVSGLPALIEPWIGRMGGFEEIIEERFEQSAMWRITLPARTDVTEADRIQTREGRYFEVKFVGGDQSFETNRECVCVERKSG